jgi:hypothetical protein
VNEDCFNPGFTARHPCTGALTRSPEPGKYEARQQAWFTSLIDAFERTIIRLHDWSGSRFGSGSVKPDGCLGVTLGPSGCERERERESGAGREGGLCMRVDRGEREREESCAGERGRRRQAKASKQAILTHNSFIGVVLYIQYSQAVTGARTSKECVGELGNRGMTSSSG